MNHIGAKRKFTGFDFVVYLVLILFCLSILYPIYHMVMMSFSSYSGLMKAGSTVMLTPRGFTLNGYKQLFSQKYIYTGYYQTIFRTVVGTLTSVLLMSMTAYAISKDYLPFKKGITTYFIITMFFTGGLIPTYLLIKNLNLMDRTAVFILAPPFLFNTFYMIVLRNFFMNIPASLEESARIDGANDARIFFNIVMPLSKPSLITIGLWQAVNHWNSWYDSMLYIQSNQKHVLQMHVRRLVYEQASMASAEGISFIQKADMPTADTISAVAIIVAVLPIMIIYPFIKKYFNQGIMVGAVKG